ncbi:hypothetical protein EC919_104197 [Pseudomonas graminis]|nr:hypothetical protein EC919_104197 [Pseudomonas graminis]
MIPRMLSRWIQILTYSPLALETCMPTVRPLHRRADFSAVHRPFGRYLARNIFTTGDLLSKTVPATPSQVGVPVPRSVGSISTPELISAAAHPARSDGCGGAENEKAPADAVARDSCVSSHAPRQSRPATIEVRRLSGSGVVCVPHFRLSTSRPLPKEPTWLWRHACNKKTPHLAGSLKQCA